jgi:hypothetical protein
MERNVEHSNALVTAAFGAFPQVGDSLRNGLIIRRSEVRVLPAPPSFYRSEGVPCPGREVIWQALASAIPMKPKPRACTPAPPRAPMRRSPLAA